MKKKEMKSLSFDKASYDGLEYVKLLLIIA